MPTRRDLPPIPAVPKLPRSVVTKLPRQMAEEAEQLAKIARRFARVDARYSPHLIWDWKELYEQLIQSAEHIQRSLRRAKTEEATVAFAWTLQLAPSAAQLARRPWAPIQGLSPGFSALQDDFEAALFRWAETYIPFAWVTYDRFQNPYEEHGEIQDAYGQAYSAMFAVVREIMRYGWPRTPADRLLMRRAIEVGYFDDSVFFLKYRRSVRTRQRERGEHLPERRIPRPERLVMYSMDYHSSMRLPLDC